jgi:hypothetical protein
MTINMKFEKYEKICRKHLDRGEAVLCPVCGGYWIHDYLSIYTHWTAHEKMMEVRK